VWPALIHAFKKIIQEHRSTLCQQPQNHGKVTRLINETETEDLAYAHHGSLSREIRLAVEKKLKNGELRAIVATNSLTRYRHRKPGSGCSYPDAAGRFLGPAAHRTFRPFRGETSSGLLSDARYGFCGRAVMARAVLEQDIEEARQVGRPRRTGAGRSLDDRDGAVDIDELYAFLKASYPYRLLPRKHFDLVIEMLAGRYADTRLRELKARVSLDRIDNTIQAHSEAAYLIYTSGGTIPERGYFDLRLKDTHAKIGELDEEFVWERSIGETFTLGSQLWRIEKITHNDVEVVQARSVTGIFPFWRAEDRTAIFIFPKRSASFLSAQTKALIFPISNTSS
jgi:ATP-dependent Lhr-like helicase